MFEHRSQPLLPLPAYLRRLARHGGLALAVVLGSLVLGIVGYHTFEGLAWIDATLNAAMILGGMGPVDLPMRTTAGKLFASFYALYSGLVILGAAGLLFAPLVHRLLHRFHLELDSESDKEDSST